MDYLVKPLSEKAIVVTGAGRGIGRAYAKRFAELGASIVVNDIDRAAAEATAAAIKSDGGKATAHIADIVSWDQAQDLVASCTDAYGRIDGLVNNAATFTVGRLDEYRPGDFDRLLSVNIIGTLNCAAHAVQQMLAQGSGSILNVVSGAHMGVRAMGCYGATKGAVASFTYSWAAELEGTGVRVNAISPMAQTSMGDAFASYLQDHGQLPITSTITPASNVDVAAYLLSDDAAGIHGQVVRIEGQQLSLVAHPAVALPLLTREDGWDYSAVREAFADELSARQVPVGIVGARIAEYRPASALWDDAALPECSA